jgi:NitT/TauT family transport system substrate-binding protein
MDPLPYAIEAEANGIPSRAVYILDYSITGDVVVGRPELNSMADLKGRTVSFEGFNSFSHIMVVALVEKAGLTEADVNFQNIPVVDVVEALDEGRIDAGHTWEPTKTKALNKGYKIIGRAGDIPGLVSDVLTFHAHVVKERPEDVKKVIRSLEEAREFVQTNREEALEIMSRHTGIGKEEMESGIMGAVNPDIRENMEAMQDIEGKVTLFTSANIIINFYIKRGQISRIPDIHIIIHRDLVEQLFRGQV